MCLRPRRGSVLQWEGLQLLALATFARFTPNAERSFQFLPFSFCLSLTRTATKSFLCWLTSLLLLSSIATWREVGGRLKYVDELIEEKAFSENLAVSSLYSFYISPWYCHIVRVGGGGGVKIWWLAHYGKKLPTKSRQEDRQNFETIIFCLSFTVLCIRPHSWRVTVLSLHKKASVNSHHCMVNHKN